jgi:hypothetical protein
MIRRCTSTVSRMKGDTMTEAEARALSLGSSPPPAKSCRDGRRRGSPTPGDAGHGARRVNSLVRHQVLVEARLPDPKNEDLHLLLRPLGTSPSSPAAPCAHHWESRKRVWRDGFEQV